MPTNWRALFDSIQVPWRDRGKNVGRGVVAICCPWCGADDTGYHLGIVEEHGGYHCLRSPHEHRGRDHIYLLMALGCGLGDAMHLLHEHRADEPAERKRERPEILSLVRQYEAFPSAVLSVPCLRYLSGADRGFADSAHVCQRYDLRYAPAGRHANRVLLPFRRGDQLVGWTGRALYSHMSVRYLTELAEDAVYVPRALRDTVIIVEGPFDALKLAAVTEDKPVSAVALTGLDWTDSRLLQIADLIRDAGSRHISICLDAEVPRAETNRLVAALYRAVGSDNRLHIRRLALPDDAHDIGGLPDADARDWVLSKESR